MSVLIALCVYSTPENGKDKYLRKCLESLDKTVNLKEHKLQLSINAYTPTTSKILNEFNNVIDHISWNDENLGTAQGINLIWKNRLPGQHCIKMDDDVVIHQPDWLELMLECIARDPQIGIIGLKRKDCIEKPSHPDPYFKSELQMLPQKPGEKWLIVEEVAHAMGTCQLYNSALLDKIGYLYQPKLYGWDDVLACARSRAAGFKNVFLPQIEIDHIDPGDTPYQKWKERVAGTDIEMITRLMEDYKTGAKDIYYNPFL